MRITKRHLTELQLKLENIKEPWKKLAGKIKNDSKSLYVYVRSKQKVRDKVGPLENNRGNIISDGFQMAEVLNEYFSSVLTQKISAHFQFHLLNLRAIHQNI